jgi:spore maturation protein CgeB
VFLPYGCVQSKFESFSKDFDVCFIGNIHGNRRERILNALRNEFSFFPTFSPGFGAAKIDAVRRSRVLLNLKFYPDGGFEGPRVFDYLANGAFVLSEFSQCTLPFVDGRDFVQFLGEVELLEKLRWFLKEETARDVIARQGHETCQNFTYDRIAGMLLEFLLDCELCSASQRRVRWMASRVRSILFQFRDTAAAALRPLRRKE